MNVSQFITLYLISIPTFIFFDLVWLGFVAKDFYQTKLGHLLGPVNWTAAGVFYLLFLIGLTYFAIYPAAQAGSWRLAVLYGGLFGFFTYLTYDLTNLATLKSWPISVVLVDIVWGIFIGAAVSVITVSLYLWYK